MIDWVRISELQSDMGKAGFDEVLVLFLEEMEEKFENLTDTSDRAAELHFIKGCGLNLGFKSLVACCTNAESNAKVSFSDIRDCYEKSKEALLLQLHATA